MRTSRWTQQARTSIYTYLHIFSHPDRSPRGEAGLEPPALSEGAIEVADAAALERPTRASHESDNAAVFTARGRKMCHSLLCTDSITALPQKRRVYFQICGTRGPRSIDLSDKSIDHTKGHNIYTLRSIYVHVHCVYIVCSYRFTCFFLKTRKKRRKKKKRVGLAWSVRRTCIYDGFIRQKKRGTRAFKCTHTHIHIHVSYDTPILRPSVVPPSATACPQTATCWSPS